MTFSKQKYNPCRNTYILWWFLSIFLYSFMSKQNHIFLKWFYITKESFIRGEKVIHAIFCVILITEAQVVVTVGCLRESAAEWKWCITIAQVKYFLFKIKPITVKKKALSLDYKPYGEMTGIKEYEKKIKWLYTTGMYSRNYKRLLTSSIKSRWQGEPGE